MKFIIGSSMQYLLCGVLLVSRGTTSAAQDVQPSTLRGAIAPQPVALTLGARSPNNALQARWGTNARSASVGAMRSGRAEHILVSHLNADLDSLPQQIPIAPYVVGGALAGAAGAAYLMYWHVQKCDACFFGEAAITAAGLVGAASGAVAGLIVYSFVRERARSKTSR